MGYYLHPNMDKYWFLVQHLILPVYHICRPQIAVCGLQSTNNITACLAARRYQISHRVWKNIPCVSAASEWNIFEHEKRNFVSLSGHVKMFYLCINQWNTKPFHLNVPISYIKYAPCNIWLDFSFVLQHLKISKISKPLCPHFAKTK